MQELPEPSSQYPQQQWQQQNTSWGSPPQWQQFELLPPQYPQSMQPSQQQPNYVPPQQWQQQPYPYQQPTPPARPPQKPSFLHHKVGCLPLWVLLLIGVLFLCGGVGELSKYGASLNTTASTDTRTNVASTQQSTDLQATPTQALKPTPTQKPKPTPKPAPTQSPAQVEQKYKSTTTNTTVIDLDKQGNNYQYKQVHFTAQILNFVKDDSGNTAGANVDTPNSFSSAVIQVAFPVGTDLSQLNQGDTIEVWGLDGGTSSGQNAFGGTVQEVGIVALYMTDLTTDYHTT